MDVASFHHHQTSYIQVLNFKVTKSINNSLIIIFYNKKIFQMNKKLFCII